MEDYQRRDAQLMLIESIEGIHAPSRPATERFALRKFQFLSDNGPFLVPHYNQLLRNQILCKLVVA